MSYSVAQWFHCPAAVCVFLQFFNAASLGWNLVWVLNFALELYDPLRNTRSLMKYYHTLVWIWALVTSLYIVASGDYGCVCFSLLSPAQRFVLSDLRLLLSV